MAAYKENIVYIQYIRAAAALLVVCHHMLHSKSAQLWGLQHSEFGWAGVLIFFVISGFVMMHSCRNDPPLVFVMKRIIRVMPLYWIMTLAFFVLLFGNDLTRGEPFRRVPDLVQSLLFIPHFHTSVPDRIWPILVPGWTLNYEMFFFAVFALGIAAGRTMLVVTFALVALVLAGFAVEWKRAVPLTWTSPLLLMFLSGIGLAWLWERMSFADLVPVLPLGLLLLVTAATGTLPPTWTHLALAVAAIATVVGGLACQSRWPQFHVPIWEQIGDASYSIYLLHTILMFPLFKVLSHLPLEVPAVALAASCGTVVLCTVGGLLCYAWLERPLLTACRRLVPPMESKGAMTPTPNA